MSTIANKDIRDAAKRANVFLWEIADKLSIQDSGFSRKLRKELPAQEKEKILKIISELARDQQEVG